MKCKCKHTWQTVCGTDGLRARRQGWAGRSRKLARPVGGFLKTTDKKNGIVFSFLTLLKLWSAAVQKTASAFTPGVFSCCGFSWDGGGSSLLRPRGWSGARGEFKFSRISSSLVRALCVGSDLGEAPQQQRKRIKWRCFHVWRGKWFTTNMKRAATFPCRTKAPSLFSSVCSCRRRIPACPSGRPCRRARTSDLLGSFLLLLKDARGFNVARLCCSAGQRFRAAGFDGFHRPYLSWLGNRATPSEESLVCRAAEWWIWMALWVHLGAGLPGGRPALEWK